MLAAVGSFVTKIIEMIVDHALVAVIVALIFVVGGWLVGRLQRNLPFSGKFTAVFNLERVEHREEIISKQRFRSVSGTSRVSWRLPTGELKTLTYTFTGKVVNHTLLARYVCDNGDLVDSGVFILKTTADPDLRAGMYASSSSTARDKFVVDLNYTWKKVAF